MIMRLLLPSQPSLLEIVLLCLHINNIVCVLTVAAFTVAVALCYCTCHDDVCTQLHIRSCCV